MNITAIVSELKAERNRIEGAISALEGLSSNGAANQTPKRAQATVPQKAGGLTTAGRKRLSELMKKRWAERLKKVGAKR